MKDIANKTNPPFTSPSQPLPRPPVPEITLKASSILCASGLGMADWKDLVSNALGGAVGVLIVKVSGRQSVTHEPRGGSGL